jgi:hypothetical protein
MSALVIAPAVHVDPCVHAGRSEGTFMVYSSPLFIELTLVKKAILEQI